MTDTPTSASAADAVPAAAPSPGAPDAAGWRACPTCGTANAPGASFCEACGAGLTASTAAAAVAASDGSVLAPATPLTAPAGEESPLDVGWTGAVPSAAVPPPVDDVCPTCGQGRIVDGYCDHCGTPPPDPRDHWVEAPAGWVGAVSDIGKRHSRNEDAVALSASATPGERAVLVVCDGVTMATDSHLASLAAAQAARSLLDQPLARGVGTPETWAGAAGRALTRAVLTAKDAVVETVRTDVPNPPSCTFAAAVVEGGLVVAGTVGDSRVYWLPDDPSEAAAQLGRDDSFAQEQMTRGLDRHAAENGPHAHAITRWLGKDSPDDLTPHLTTLTATSGWLLVCSDGLWNYCSDAQEVRTLLVGARERVGDEPVALAQALVDFANDQGGRDNITVALARLAGQGSNTTSSAASTAASEEGEPVDG